MASPCLWRAPFRLHLGLPGGGASHSLLARCLWLLVSAASLSFPALPFVCSGLPRFRCSMGTRFLCGSPLGSPPFRFRNPLDGTPRQASGWFCLVCLASPGRAMDTARVRKAVLERKADRAGTRLVKGRPVLATIKGTRDKLKDLVVCWLGERGKTWEGLLSLARFDVEQLNEVFIWYGQWLYEEGRPYFQFSETLNTFSTECPICEEAASGGLRHCLSFAAARAAFASHCFALAAAAGADLH